MLYRLTEEKRHWLKSSRTPVSLSFPISRSASPADFVVPCRLLGVMDERESWRPKIFYSSGPRQGLPEPFPAPTHLRRKERSSQNRGALYVPGSQSAVPGGPPFTRPDPNYHGGYSPSMRRSYQYSGSHSRQRNEDRL